MQPLVGRQLPALPTPETEQEPSRILLGLKPLHPVEQRARSRMPPLIEDSAPGIYVVISAHEGEVHLEPNSRAWFDWLATLSSFRFVGPTGRFTGHRGYKGGQQTRSWSASRCVRRHTYKHSLGVTESLTTARLEHIAARLQSDRDARQVVALFPVNDLLWLSTSAAVVFAPISHVSPQNRSTFL